MTDAADETIVSQPIRQKVVFGAQFRRPYPAVVWKLAVHYVTGLFLGRKDISAPEGASARLGTERTGMLSYKVTIEFEIIGGVSMIEQTRLCNDVYRLFIELGARRVNSDFSRVEKE